MARQQKVAIMGCGPGGSYLYSLLRRKKPGIEVVLFNMPQHTACGIKGCAWGVSWLQFAQLCREVGGIPERYMLGKYNQVLVNQLKVGAEVAMINKPLLIEDLLGGQAPLNPSGVDLNAFDRIVDATGAQRAYLSPCPNPQVAITMQTRIVVETLPHPMIFVNRDTGYSWLMPLNEGEAHLGALSHLGLEAAWQDMQKIKHSLNDSRTLCACLGQIRCHGPVRPFTEGKIWGLGETIGLVDPIAGAGIVPAMTSAKLMVENWESAANYERRIWRRYSYMAREARAVSGVIAGKKTEYLDMILPRRAFETIGVKPSISQIISAILRVRKW